MKRVVVSVFDHATGLYGMPMVFVARGAAMRSFIDEVNRKGEDNGLFAHPEDFEMRVLSEFDDETGVFTAPSEGVGAVLLRGKDARNTVQ